MTLHITDEAMTGETSGQSARPAGEGWELSWLPGRILGRDQAISGLALAEESAAGTGPGDARWSLIGVLAAELGLTADDAAARVFACRQPEDYQAAGTGPVADCRTGDLLDRQRQAADEWEAGL